MSSLRDMDNVPNDLWQDMSKLNALYGEMCWGHEDILEFSADYENNRIIIRNKTMEGRIWDLPNELV